jgi:hypothetical protein
MGYSMGRAKFSSGRRSKLHLALALALPIGAHGLYDFLMQTVPSRWLWIMVPFMFLLWLRGIRSVNRANAISPFRLLKREEEVKP